MKGTKKTIAFRLEPELLRLLSDRAEQHGISPGSRARLFVIDGLLAESPVLEVLRKVEERQMRLERHLRILTVALLVDAGKASVEDAEAFARETFSEQEACGQC